MLSIGPRSEAELLTVLAAGFDGCRIRALDLFSLSPWIDVGDMHDMAYADDSFDVVLIGWVLAYSKNPKQAVSEIIRVTRPGGYVSVGWDACTDFENHPKRPSLDTRAVRGCDEIGELFGAAISDIIFQGIIDERNGDDRAQLVYTVRLR